MSEENLSFQETLDCISRFLEAAIHTLLCLRQVYPADIFERKKLFDVPVWRSRHPKLSSYIAQAVDAVVERLQDGTVDKAILAIKDATSDEALEHFVFRFQWLGEVAASQFKTEQERQARPITGTPRSHVDLLLRGLLLKIASIDSQLLDLPPELTFAILLEMIPGAVPPTEPNPESGEAPPWIPDQSKSETDTPTGAVLRKTRLGHIAMYISAEETDAKVALDRRQQSRDLKGKGRALD